MAQKRAKVLLKGLEMKQNLVNARITFRNSPIHVLERFTFKDLKQHYPILENILV